MPRVDAQRNMDALLTAAKEEFSASGVDVNVRAIAARAGVGTATLYRHYPLRSDLIAAVFRQEIDEVAAAAGALAASAESPFEALSLWLRRYTSFVATKQGLASALHSGDPAYNALPGYFEGQVGGALQGLLDAAEASGEIRGGVGAVELLGAVANLSVPLPGEADASRPFRMVELLLDGLRYGAGGGR